jgi:RNA recognition motif-containing protein
MSSIGKRQREAEKARRKRHKAEIRQRKRERGPGEVPITTADEITGDLLAAEDAMRARSAAPRAARAIPARLFVGSLSWSTSEDSLREAFGKYGAVTDAVIVKDRDTGKSRGFGFVTMENRKDAARAIEELDGTELDGRDIVVNMATERQR